MKLRIIVSAFLSIFLFASHAQVKIGIIGLDTSHAIAFQNFFNAIREGSKLNSPLVEACTSTQLVQLANISHRVRRTLEINNKGTIIDDREALKKYWKRDYEKGWELKV